MKLSELSERIGGTLRGDGELEITGSSMLGKGVMMGGQVGLTGHVKVGDGAVVGVQAGVSKNVASRTFVTGYPAMPHRKAAKAHAHLMRLPEWKDRARELEQRIASLEKELSKD